MSVIKEFDHLKIQLESIKSATNDFSEDNCIGKGGFGKVYKGELVQPNGSANTVAIKRLDRAFGQGDPEFWKEIIMLSLYKHENIVSLLGFCDDSGEKILVYEYLSKHSLDFHLNNNDLTWVRRLRICIGAARGLAYLHNPFGTQQRVLHRDIKSSNILLDVNWNARISDLGLSKFGPANQRYTFLVSNAVGTVGYCDPLYVETGLLTKESDVYSFGVVLFEVLCGRLSIGIEDKRKPLTGLVRRCYEENTLNDIIYGNIKDEINPDSLRVYTTIAYRCLKIERGERPLIDEIVTELEIALRYQDTQHEHIGFIPGNPTASSDRSSALLTVRPPPLPPTMEQNYSHSRAKELETSSSKTFVSDKSKTTKPEKMLAKMKIPKLYSEYFLYTFFIPDYILVPDGEVEVLYDVPPFPTIVFINSKSGGQLGAELLITYRSVLNKNQVFDLGEEAPNEVLRKLYLNLEYLKRNGDYLAFNIEKQLRIIVAGGDGTAAWLLGVVSDMKLSHPPLVTTMPLGMENNLPSALGWGKKNPGTNRESVTKFLEQVFEGKEMKIDSWHILLWMKSPPKEGSCDPIAPLELPHSLHAFNRVSVTDEVNLSGYAFHGGFWNCFSMGLDAQVSYEFHCERKLHPEKFKNQSANQSIYMKSFTQATSLFQPSSKNIAQLMKVKIRRRHGGWVDLRIPDSISSILCLNLPSFSGGLNPWGTPNYKKSRDRDFTQSFIDDGILEIVGFGDAWQGLALLAKGHGTRLAQTNGVRFEFHKGAAEFTYMQMDGEPWKQPLPVDDDDTTVVEISHFGRVKLLATENCIFKSIYDPSVPNFDDQYEENYNDSDEEDGEEWRTFGAAEEFKLPEDVGISHLS